MSKFERTLESPTGISYILLPRHTPPPSNSFQPDSPGGRGSFRPRYQVMLSLGLTEQFSPVGASCWPPHTSPFPLVPPFSQSPAQQLCSRPPYSRAGLPNTRRKHSPVQASFWAAPCVTFRELLFFLPQHYVSFIHANVSNCYSFPPFYNILSYAYAMIYQICQWIYAVFLVFCYYKLFCYKHSCGCLLALVRVFPGIFFGVELLGPECDFPLLVDHKSRCAPP